MSNQRIGKCESPTPSSRFRLLCRLNAEEGFKTCKLHRKYECDIKGCHEVRVQVTFPFHYGCNEHDPRWYEAADDEYEIRPALSTLVRGKW